MERIENKEAAIRMTIEITESDNQIAVIKIDGEEYEYNGVFDIWFSINKKREREYISGGFALVLDYIYKKIREINELISKQRKRGE